MFQLCGQAGQGIQTVEFLLTRILKRVGYNVFATKEYMSRVRGGCNSTTIRVSSRPVRALADRIDLLIALDKGAIKHVGRRISDETVVLVEKDALDDEALASAENIIGVPFTKTAIDIGNKVYSNVVAVGAIVGILGIDLDTAANYVSSFFLHKAGEIVDNNVKAVKAGHEVGRELAESGKVKLVVGTDENVQDHILVNGAEAVGLGAIAGGCNFISSYPMSPSTGVLVFLAGHAAEFGIIVEQAEDEIAAINMAIGAWYAGARGMVTTSGGGFALMTEGLSLAGMLDMPMVIHLAQRPGPATGLPTRTEQGDLEMALYGGHGEFPRIILAPGSVEDAFYLTQKAFNLADKYQVPVFVLTDEYLMDTYYNVPPFDLNNLTVDKHIVESAEGYRRYELTANGVSPRAIPGFGTGLVSVDSDEHDEQGHITEDLDFRVRMVDKRLKKAETMSDDIIAPVLTGPVEHETLIVCWGSTYNVVNEALRFLGRDDVAFLHFEQVYPIHPVTADYLAKAKRTIIVEGNATSQFARLIKVATGIDIGSRILKYNGLNFSVEELTGQLCKLLN